MENIDFLHDKDKGESGAVTPPPSAQPVTFTKPETASADAASSEKPKGGFLRSVSSMIQRLFASGKAKDASTRQGDAEAKADGSPHILSIEKMKTPDAAPHQAATPKEGGVPTPATPTKPETDTEKKPSVSSQDTSAGGPLRDTEESHLGVNLVPEELLSGSKRHNQLLLYGLSVGLSVLFIALVFVGMTLFERNIISTTEERQAEIAAIDQQLKTLGPSREKAVQLDKDLGQIVQMLDTHTYWTKYFSLIEKYTIDTVLFRSVTADLSGRMTLSASGPDYRSVARQLIAFQEAKDLVETVSITAAASAQTDEGTRVDFSVSIKFLDSALHCTALDCPTLDT